MQWFASREPARALAAAQRWARKRGADAAVLASGSVYLVGELLAHGSDDAPIRLAATGRSAEAERMNDEGPSVLKMVGFVALAVALVILVFFAAGYGFGRLFL